MLVACAIWTLGATLLAQVGSESAAPPVAGQRVQAEASARVELSPPGGGTELPPAKKGSAAPWPEAWQAALDWRFVGPPRGGRSAAVCGIRGDRNTYWFGACGGGVWKTRDRGRTWRNMSDGFFGGSIGAVAVAPSDANVVYVGGGEKTVRGNVSHGDGLWRSTDAGETWTHLGLAATQHISRIRVHPKDPNTLWLAAMGHLHGPNPERGVYRSRDGGETFELVLTGGDAVGAVDLALDATNPRVLYASLWRVRRTPYSLSSGGEGSGLWKSTDGGDTWTDLSETPGFPKGPLGIIGVSPSPADPKVVYAIVEAKDGGVLRSQDGGQSWRRTSSNASLRQRAWYYTRLEADPVDVDRVYVMNVGFHRSRDGGRSFERIGTPHSDNHDLWIDPDDPQRMIEANDGGANVSEDGGRSWSAQDNQPTAQMYRVSLDDDFPYRLLGGQQDNSAVRIRSRSATGRRIGTRDWEPTAGGESGHIVAKPGAPHIVVGGSYGGYLTVRNHKTGESRTITVWPDNPMGAGAGDLKYRFQWNFPILFSPHDPETLYCAAQCVFRSRDLGASWEQISPDLTRDDPTKLGSSGGPITKDNTSVEYYCTIFAFAESPLEAGLLWAGSDDGLLHVSRDAGKAWNAVTPPWPEWTMVNSIEAHPTIAGGLYVAGTRYRLDDYEPQLWRTLDYGETWSRIDAGLPREAFTRVIRADPKRAGLLYAGTERGVHASFDDGATWGPLQGDLPIVPVTDLAVRGSDLIAATQGRGYWLLDGLAALHAYQSSHVEEDFQVYPPEAGYRLHAGAGSGVRFHWSVGPEADLSSLQLDIHAGDRILRRFAARGSRGSGGAFGGDQASRTLPVAAGLNTWTFDLRHFGPEGFDGMVLWNGLGRGPRLAPGRYEAHFHWEGQPAVEGGDGTSEPHELRVPFTVVADPRGSATPEDFSAQEAFCLAVRDELTRTHRAIRRLRIARGALGDWLARAGESEDTEAAEALRERARDLRSRLGAIEKVLYQTRSRSRQDPLNYPIRLNDKLSGVLGAASRGDRAPTAQAVAVREALMAEIEPQLAALEAILTTEWPAFEEALREAGEAILPTPRLREDG